MIHDLFIPRPFAIAIDDLGWMDGTNEGEDGNQGPYRLGIKRKMTLNDYKTVVNLAKKAGVRLQGLFILSEMDRENVCAKYPTTTYKREHWDNKNNVSDLEFEMIDYVVKESAHLEFGLHGVGHEFWDIGQTRRRAEWYNKEDKKPWAESEIINHVECFKLIMAQYGLTLENGHSFPQSFVPCSYSFYWNPEAEYSLGAVLGSYGVKFANTDFREIPELNPPSGVNGGGFDHEVHVMNRFNYGNLWYELAKLPEVEVSNQGTDFIETHWSNLLAQDDFLQEEVTNKWVEYLKSINKMPERYCSKNTHQHHSQWAYNQYVKVINVSDGKWKIDNSAMPEAYISEFFPGNMVIKLPLSAGLHLSEAKFNNESIAGYFENEGFGYAFLPPLKAEMYDLELAFSGDLIAEIIWHNGTFNIYQGWKNNQFEVCVYGTQKVMISTSIVPLKVISSNEQLKVISFKNEDANLIIELEATDFQGDRGMIRVFEK